MEAFLIPAFIYLVAGVVAVPLASRFGMGSVLGYLIAGVVIGPILGVVGAETQNLQHFAEFGVVMMLFLIGLELEPKNLWSMRRRLFGLGGLQVGLTVIAVTLSAMAFGIPWSIALAIGLVLALSSTAIVLQTLEEKGLVHSEGGRASFLVLLFQDMAVIPMLALIPLLANPELMISSTVELATHADPAGGEVAHTALNFVESLPGWAATLFVLAAVAIVVLGGHFLTRPVFNFVAQARRREVFVAAALLLVIGIALLMTAVGLSPALGTFLAGVVLANSEYRHELEADIEPFKGLLLGLFFITVGAGINFSVLFADLFTILGLTFALMLVKAVILFGIARLFGLKGSSGWLFTLGLAQTGEFAFVLLSFSTANSVIPADMAQKLALIVALSMLLTPLLFIFYEKVIAGRSLEDPRPEDEIHKKGTVIIAGLGRFGQIVNRMMLREGHKTVVLDHRYETIDGLRKFGVESFYGDPSRPELLEAAGIKEAKLLIVAIDDQEKAVSLVNYVHRRHPHVHIVARAHDRVHTYQLYAAGAREIVRETFDSAVRAGRYSLEALGHHPFYVERASRRFIRDDQETLRHLAEVWDPGISVFDNTAYMERAREQLILQEDAARSLQQHVKGRSGRAWMPPPKGGTPKE